MSEISKKLEEWRRKREESDREIEDLVDEAFETMNIAQIAKASGKTRSWVSKHVIKL